MSINKFESELKKAFFSGLFSFLPFGNKELDNFKGGDCATDKKALQRDWERVGSYLNWAILQESSKQKKEKDKE